MASNFAHEDKEEAPEDWRSNCSSHLAQMSYALEHGVLSDVSFLVGDSKEVIRGHRSILSIGSPVFQALLTGKSIDENPIEIQAVQLNGFKHLLKYLYTGVVPEIPDEDCLEFFKAVKYFMVRRLYTICEESILKQMTTGNALKVYEDGQLLGENDLEDAADAFIKKNAEAILAEPKFLQLSLDNLQHFISSDDFSAKEISICLAVYKWGEAECDRQKLEKSPENLRFVLRSIIPQIRFPLMDPEEFALQIAPLLTIEEHHLLSLTIPQNKRGILPGGRFISKPRISMQNKVVKKRMDEVKQVIPNTPLEKKKNMPIVNLGVWISRYADLKIGKSYTLSNTGVGTTNYLTDAYSNGVHTLIIIKGRVAKYGYLSIRWVIGQGSEPNSYTLYSKSYSGDLRYLASHGLTSDDTRKIMLSGKQAQNLTFERSQTPGYFILTCGPKNPNLILAMGTKWEPNVKGFVPVIIRKPDIENDSILWNIRSAN